MKSFDNYCPKKYSLPDYERIEDDIYLAQNPYGDGKLYVTSLSFQQEPEAYGEEDGSPRNITQIPFEGLLDEFCVAVTDFYEELNEQSDLICYQEFGSFQLAHIQKLREIIGKRLFAAPYMENGEEYYRIVIE